MENFEIAKSLLTSFHRFKRIFKAPNNFAGLKHSEMGLLFQIKGGCSDDPEGMKVSELSSKLHVTSPSITQLVTGLEEQGLVARTMDKEDRRSVKVTLTEKGREVTGNAERQLMGTLAGLVDHLGPEKTRAFVEILDDVFEYFSKKEI